MCTYSGLQTFCVCSLVFLVSHCLYDSESRTPEFHSSHPPSLAFGPPKCDVSHLVVTRSALCSSAGVTRRYSVTPAQHTVARSHSQKPARHHQHPSRVTCKVHITLRPSSITDILAQWTKDGWDFQPRHLEEGRVRNAPLRYLVGHIRWRAVQVSGIPQEESIGYYAEAPTRKGITQSFSIENTVAG
jgi:hypothetical protein